MRAESEAANTTVEDGKAASDKLQDAESAAHDDEVPGFTESHAVNKRIIAAQFDRAYEAAQDAFTQLPREKLGAKLPKQVQMLKRMESQNMQQLKAHRDMVDQVDEQQFTTEGATKLIQVLNQTQLQLFANIAALKQDLIGK